MLAVLAGLISVAPVANAEIDQAAVPTSPASEALTECVAQSKKLLVVFLVDTSGSLNKNGRGGPGSDVGNNRVDGLKAALEGLSRLSQGVGSTSGPQIQVLVRGFSTDYEPGVDWTEVTPDSVGGFQTEVESFQGRNRGAKTDYNNALKNASVDLSIKATQEAAGGSPPPCKAVVWFTDGKYDPAKDRKVSADAAKLQLCAPDGPVEELRLGGVTMFTVGLGSPSFDAVDQDYLRAVTEGSANGQSCGTHGSASTGKFIPAAQAGDLALIFSTLFNGGEIRTGDQQFTVVEGIGKFSIDYTIPDEGGSARLIDPSGAVVTLANTSVSGEFKDATIKTPVWFTNSNGAALEVAGEGSAWNGTWRIEFPGHEDAKSSVVLYPDFYAVAVKPALRAGEPAALTFALEDASGNRLTNDSAVLQNARVEITSPNSPAPSPPSEFAEDGTFTTQVDLPAEYPDTSYTVNVRATVAGDGGGIAAQPVDSVVKLDVKLPEGFPQISPSELHPKAIENTDPTSATLTVTGPEGGGDGCVLVNREFRQESAPNNVDISISTDADGVKCLTVPEGEQRSITVTFTPSDGGRGRVSGTIPVDITDARGKRLTRNVPVAFEMATPNWAVRAGAVALGVLLSLLVSYLVLRITNYMVARFERPGLLRFAQFQVTVHSEEPFIRPDGAPLQGLRVELADLDDVAYSSLNGKSRSPRSFEKGGLQFAASAGNRELLSGPTGTVRSASGRLLGGALLDGDRLGTDALCRVVTVPLGMTNLWVFELDRADASEDIVVAAIAPSTMWSTIDDEVEVGVALLADDVTDAVLASGTLTYLISEATFVDTAKVMVDDTASRIHAVLADLASVPRPDSPEQSKPPRRRTRRSQHEPNPPAPDPDQLPPIPDSDLANFEDD